MALKYEDLQDRIYQQSDGRYAVWIPAEDGRIRKTAASREKLEAAVRKYLRSHGESSVSPSATVEDVFRDFCEDRAQYVSAATVTRDISFWKRNVSGAEMSGREMAATSATDWVVFLQRILSGGPTAKQWAGIRSVVRAFLHYAEDTGIICFTAEDVFSRIRIRKGQFARAAAVKIPELQVFSEEETARIKQYCRENPDAYNRAILLLFASGLRVGELVCLKKEDILPETLQVRVSRTETQYYEHGTRHKVTAVKDKPKTEAGLRMVSVPESERDLLKEIRSQAGRQSWCFCRIQRGKHIRINAQGIRKRLYLICKKIGIPRRSPHKIRRTYASILLDARIDENLVIQQMGHVDISTTEAAYHKDRKTAARKAKILSGIPELNE